MLSEAGLRAGVALAPILPGLTDDARGMAAVLAAAREATVNAAKWSRAPVISLFAEVAPGDDLAALIAARVDGGPRWCLAERDDAELEDVAVSGDRRTAVPLWNGTDSTPLR